MKQKLFTLLLLLLLFRFYSYPQEQNRDFSVLFYNVENLFDAVDDPGLGDDEFIPEADRHWTGKRFNQKILNISKVILNASGFYPPDIIALCEIENRNVLEKLLLNTPLKSKSYKIIHKESPDHRGIDVALIYNPDRIYPLSYSFYPLVENNSILKTREILYFSGIADGKDTLHFFVNHWPSRFGGLLETQQERNIAALLLKEKTDSLFQLNHGAKIIVFGDFNDQPTDKSLTDVLSVLNPETEIIDNRLYNLSFLWVENEPGTIKYQSQWSVFDQFIVSGALLIKNRGFSTIPENAKTVSLPFLLEPDEKFGGQKPKRTYNGFSYEGGFSDHLPVILKLTSEN